MLVQCDRDIQIVQEFGTCLLLMKNSLTHTRLGRESSSTFVHESPNCKSRFHSVQSDKLFISSKLQLPPVHRWLTISPVTSFYNQIAFSLALCNLVLWCCCCDFKWEWPWTLLVFWLSDFDKGYIFFYGQTSSSCWGCTYSVTVHLPFFTRVFVLYERPFGQNDIVQLCSNNKDLQSRFALQY